MSAVPASDSPILRTLPDGTSIEIMLHGDENFHYATLLDGSIVKQGDDGYFYYAEVTADGIVATPYKVGDNVKITDGALESFIGTVDELDLDRGKVRVVVSMFGRETPVELELDQVELV